MKNMNIKTIYVIGCLFVFMEVNAKSVCKLKETNSLNGGYRELQVGKTVLVDVDSFRELDSLVFYATSPVYGKPELGVVNCIDGKISVLESAKNKNKSYPEGADFFRLKKVEKSSEPMSYVVRYFYISDVDSKNFKLLETDKNLKLTKFSKK